MYFFPLFERECLQIFVARKNIPVTTCTKLYYVASCMLHLFSYTVKVKFPLSGPESIQFPFMGTRTASPRGRYGERPQRDSVWRYICKNTTCWPATAHDVTTGVPQYKCRRENTSSAFSSSLTGLFEACNLVRVQFSLYQMASTSKAFKIVCG